MTIGGRQAALERKVNLRPAGQPRRVALGLYLGRTTRVGSQFDSAKGQSH